MQHVHHGNPHLTSICYAVICSNSEIYNHEDVQQQYLSGVSMVRDSKSDSAKPGHLYEKYGDDDKIWNALDGTFACVICDERTQQFCAARDPIGICPMYWGKDASGATWFASEMKALQHQCVSFEIFPPVRKAITAICTNCTCESLFCLSMHYTIDKRERERDYKVCACLSMMQKYQCNDCLATMQQYRCM